MADLFLVRLHSDKCPHRRKGQQFLRCKCTLGVDGTLKGKRYRKSLNTRSLDKAYRKLAAIEGPDYQEPKSIQDAIETFRLSKEDVGHGTKRNHRRALDNFLRIAKAAGITNLDDVEIDTIDLFRAKRTIAATTWTKELTILRSFFGFCVSRKWMSSNPAKEVKPQKVKAKPKERYTQEEVVQILSACDQLGRGAYERSRARAMVLFAPLHRSSDERYGKTRPHPGAKRPHLLAHHEEWEAYFSSDTFGTAYLPRYFASAERNHRAIEAFVLEWKRHHPGFHSQRHANTGLRFRNLRSGRRTCASIPAYLSNCAVGKSWTTEDVALVLGSTPDIIRRHYAQWTVQRQERISSLAQDV